jgi:hypothetical protein
MPLEVGRAIANLKSVAVLCSEDQLDPHPTPPPVERNPFDDTDSKFAARQRQGLVRPVYSSRDGMESNRLSAGSRRWDTRPSWYSAVYGGKRPSGKAESVVSPEALRAYPVTFDANGKLAKPRFTRNTM